ncbi:eCIS core domain-containing protein [Undibacterium macrobrachii]|uniref:DUF4157 domain-containing protein n=1 Tax=Undibacterium macrobrachii TaxID=1119058 RepID=A0ABQ2XB88_9BURK|nr:DUF4157 domain-containing protein [Undibacterium macrobrachii]GGX08468.1 hypothetical protein GCM10011282_13200 [Undibacterium macrobrachii]
MSSAVPMQHAHSEATQPAHARVEQASAYDAPPVFVDQRSQAISQRRLQDIVNNSSQTRQLKLSDQLAQNSIRSTQLRTMSAMTDVPVLQKMEDEEAIQAQTQDLMAQRREVETTSPQPNNTGLPDNLKSGIESLSGMSMDHVKVHYNSAQPAQLNAHAYAQGSEIHVAPGQEQHLPHEAWHVVQQAQGRVKPTMQMKAGAPVNDDAGLETEADVMGAKALGLGSVQRKKSAGVLTQAKSSSALDSWKNTVVTESVMQRKSKFKSNSPRELNAATPLASLHAAFQGFFKSAGLSESYTFHSLQKILPNDSTYSGSFSRAGEVVASIDPKSSSKADSKNRDNSVIGPYGHFGVMERAIFNRQNLGNTYDGGHLVEHTLMEGQTADVHGNLAPQENKNFNQGLMRGWESVPEHLMSHGHKFDYSVKVEYQGDDYVRTGEQLVDAGVINRAILNMLPTKGNQTATDLKNTSVTFRRWVPTFWTGTVDKGGTKNIPLLAFNKGAHFHNLQSSKQTAQDLVIEPNSSAQHTRPGIKRTNSGFLAGYFETATTFGGTMIHMGQQPSFSGFMFQPEPQDLRDQPTATTTPKGMTPSVLPTTNTKVNLLPVSIRIGRMFDDLMNVERKKGSGGPVRSRNKSDGPVDKAAKEESKDYLILRGNGGGPLATRAFLSNPAKGASFVAAVQNHMTSSGSKTKADFADVVRATNLPVKEKNKMLSLELDPNLKL